METKSVTAFKTIEMPTRTLAYVHNVGPYKDNTELFGKLFNEVIAWLTPRQLLLPSAECITMYHDDPETVPLEQQRISAGFTVPEGTQGEGNIQIMEIPAGKYLIGSFEILSSEYEFAWGEVMQQMNESNLIPTGTMYESYKNDPRQHPEGKHVVDICVAVH